MGRELNTSMYIADSHRDGRMADTLPGLWSQSRRLGLETVSRHISDSSRSRLDENCQRLGLVSVSAIDVYCTRRIFRQISQVTVIELIKSGVAVKYKVA